MINENDKGKAICQDCKKVVTVTYNYADISFSDGSGTVSNVLLGICDLCQGVACVPSTETYKIKEEYQKRIDIKD